MSEFEFKIPEDTKVDYYIRNPLSPTMHMILPKKYRLECDTEWDICMFCSQMLKHSYALFENYNLTAYPILEIDGMMQYIKDIYATIAQIIYKLTTCCDITDVPSEINRVYREYHNNEITLKFMNDRNESIYIKPDNKQIDKYNLILGTAPFIFRTPTKCDYGEFKVVLYGVAINGGSTKLPDSYDLYLPTDMEVYDIIDRLIDHIKRAEQVYNIPIYIHIIDPTRKILKEIWGYISYYIVNTIAITNGDDDISDDIIDKCVGSGVIYDTSKKCMGYQDPNAIIGFRLVYIKDDDNYDVISYHINGAPLSNIIKDINILIRFLPYTSTRVKLTKEDMKSII